MDASQDDLEIDIAVRGSRAAKAQLELLRAEIERLVAAIAYVRQRSARAGEILNEFDNTYGGQVEGREQVMQMETVCEYCGFGSGAHSQVCPHGNFAELQAENARLRERVAELEDPHYVKGLKAEIERLQAALKKADDIACRKKGGGAFRMQQVIRAALGWQTEDGSG